MAKTRSRPAAKIPWPSTVDTGMAAARVAHSTPEPGETAMSRATGRTAAAATRAATARLGTRPTVTDHTYKPIATVARPGPCRPLRGHT